MALLCAPLSQTFSFLFHRPASSPLPSQLASVNGAATTAAVAHETTADVAVEATAAVPVEATVAPPPLPTAAAVTAPAPAALEWRKSVRWERVTNEKPIPPAHAYYCAAGEWRCLSLFDVVGVSCCRCLSLFVRGRCFTAVPKSSV